MVGAIIGAAVSAGSALANWLTTKHQNEEIKEKLAAEQAAAKGQEITDRYGNWRYSGANQYFTKAAEEMKDYVRQQRGARRVTGAQNTGAEEAAGKAIAQAAGQAAAQREAEGLQLVAQDRARYQALKDREFGLDAAQKAATTQAFSQAANAGASIAAGLDDAGLEKGGTTTTNTPAAAAAPAAKLVATNPADPSYVKQTAPTPMQNYQQQLEDDYLKSAFKPTTKSSILGGL